MLKTDSRFDPKTYEDQIVETAMQSVDVVPEFQARMIYRVPQGTLQIQDNLEATLKTFSFTKVYPNPGYRHVELSSTAKDYGSLVMRMQAMNKTLILQGFTNLWYQVQETRSVTPEGDPLSLRVL